MNALGHLIRKVKAEDHEAVLSVITAAFEQPDEANLVKRLWDENATKVERLAEIGGVVVGYCAFSPITTTPDIAGNLLGLAPVAVAPTHQRQGIGNSLVEAGLTVCKQNKARLIAVLGEPEYYTRFGFARASDYNMRWAALDAGDAFQIILDDDLDTQKAHAIQYHPVFDEFS